MFLSLCSLLMVVDGSPFPPQTQSFSDSSLFSESTTTSEQWGNLPETMPCLVLPPSIFDILSADQKYDHTTIQGQTVLIQHLYH